jgi:hypothetical protein
LLLLVTPEQGQRTIAEQHPGWEAWQSIKGRQWHARKVGAVPPVMVHDDNVDGLSAQIEALEPGARSA